MPILKKVKPENEKELHSIIENEIDALEEGLEILKYEFGMAKGTPDFICIDSGGRLVIIEVKLQEDENILFQALRYYNEIDKERYAIAKMFIDKKIETDEHPRILLIAEKFSKPRTIKELREYITKDSLKPIFDKLIDEIKTIGKGIEEYATQDYVGFKYKGRQIAWLGPHRKSFDVGAVVIDENSHVLDNEYTRIESGTEDTKETFDKIKSSFKNIGGKVK